MSDYIRDRGPNPFVFNIENATKCNSNYRTTIWTGRNLQSTLMCIPPGDDIGLEIHPDNDQFLRIECGKGMAVMGCEKDRLNFQCPVSDGCAVFVPAGTWHNVMKVGFAKSLIAKQTLYLSDIIHHIPHKVNTFSITPHPPSK
jgi:mannose-6-phosphate isomerase-like protein (cupin superfamily)